MRDINTGNFSIQEQYRINIDSLKSTIKFSSQMNREQKDQYQQKVEKYLSSQRVYDLFQYLIKSLVVKQPEDPISLLIKTIQLSCQKTIVIKSILQNPKNIDQQIKQKKFILKTAEINFFQLFQDYHTINASELKGQIFDKIEAYSLNQNKFKELQILLNSYQKIYQKAQFNQIKNQVKQFGESTHRFLNELHFDHERSSQIAMILFQDKFLSSFGLNKPQLNIKEGFLGLSRRVFRCCEKELSSFAFLIIQMIDWANNQKMTAGQIDDSLKVIIEYLQKHYPATQDKGMQIKQTKFAFEQTKDDKIMIKLKGRTGKQKWANLNQKIVEIAKQAEYQEVKLKYITKKSCLDQNGTSFKTGTKVKGQQSIERVKEKLVQKIFQQKKNEKPYKQKFKQINRNLTIKQFLNKEKEDYDRFVESWIADQQEIQFTVDDMVRGKCMFESAADIYKAAQKIIENCKEKNVGIVKIKNRLNKKTSDLVFKLKMSKVVAQFQLALKFNVVKNEFNHKIYELLRSPGFSVTQTVFQNKEKSQRFLWDIQSMLNHTQKVHASIKSEYVQYLKRKNLLCKWDGSMLRLKRQGKNRINTEQIDSENNRFFTAIFLIKIFNYEAAKQELKKALKTTKISQEETQILYQLGSVYDDQGNQTQALKYYNRCLEIQESIKGKDSIDCASTLNNIGLVYDKKGNYPQALKYYNRCLKIQERIKGKDSIECASTLNNIGLVYNNQGNYPQALKYYNRCLETKEKIKGKDSINCASTLNNIAIVYNNQGNYPEALKNYNRCLDIQQKIKGNDSIECANTLSNIGLVYDSQGNYPQALKYYNQCLAIKEKIEGKDSIDSVITLNNIGSVYNKQGNYPQALKYYNRCLEIQENIKGKDSIDCANTLNNIGLVYNNQGNYNQALRCYNLSLEIQENVGGKDSIDCVSTLNNIGNVCNNQGYYPQALKYYNRCLEIQERIKGKESIDCATTLNNIGLVCDNQGNYPQALKYYNRCLEIEQKIKGKDSIDCASTLNNIGLIQNNQGNYSQALKYYNRCLEIEQKTKGKDSIDCASTLNNIGIVYNRQKNYPQALKYYNRCLEIQQNIKGKESIDCATTLNNIGLVYSKQSNYSQAASFYQRSWRIFDSILGPDHSNSKYVRRNLESVEKYAK